MINIKRDKNMKKTFLLVSILAGSYATASQFAIIVTKDLNNYDIEEKYTEETIDTGWKNNGSISCSNDVIAEDFYHGVKTNQTESCIEPQKRTITIVKNYDNGTQVVVSEEETTRSLETETVVEITGTHTESTCLNILNNGWEAGNKAYRLSGGYDVYCDMENGGWTLLFNHDVLVGGVFTSISEVLSVNQGDPSTSTSKYSIMNKTEEFRRNGKFEFKLGWKGYSQKQIWRQTSNPTNSSVTGYEAVSISSTSNYWAGLEYGYATNGNSSLMDGSTNHSNWFYSVGSFALWPTTCQGIPLSSDIVPANCGVPNVNLWVK